MYKGCISIFGEGKENYKHLNRALDSTEPRGKKRFRFFYKKTLSKAPSFSSRYNYTSQTIIRCIVECVCLHLIGRRQETIVHPVDI